MERHADPRIAAYEEASARHRRLQDLQRRRARLVSYGRIVTFLAAAGCAALAWYRASGLAGSAGGVLIAAFAVLVYVHARIDARERWHDALARLNGEGTARVGRKWDRLPDVPVAPPDASHPYAEDLDLFGHASVFRLLGSVGSESGRRTLRAWLLAPAEPAVVSARQAAVRELATFGAFREEFAAMGRLVPAGAHDLDAFFAWAATPGWMHAARWLVPATVVLRTAILALLALHGAGLVDRPFWLYPLAAGILLNAVYGRRIHATYTRAFSREPLFQQHAGMFARLAALPVAAPHLVVLEQRLASSGLTAAKEMAALDRMKGWSDLRFQALFHFPVNAVTLWDFFIIQSLERWQQRCGSHLQEWFEVLGEFDALSALATLAHDNPSWAFPSIRTGADRIVASGLGHPLLADDQRVVNDVEVGPPGTLLLVTGSNMSGKSTLLRSIGVNLVIAQAGGPVCAGFLSAPPLAVATSMRVQDSLEAGVSYFMAALQRLKLVVEAARRSPAGAPGLIYLLDEVLQGTNTAERQVAVRRILAHLLALPVLGVVTTHDLELAASPELREACRAVHFSEGVDAHEGDVRLSFDYKIRPGVATSRNALKLLHLVGLD
jgi:hypothetical protein